ncbi:DUF1156 domain-containing protein [Alkalimonas sp. MEB108]|uniref:DUF1156 domain-containing protein n=1 Tax=Alkalimonas cellulosilytica TaxID=3058395 RepID=A0ABU7J9P1_9GAMM|nr:anti-phage-associated DUF1156 domain-containing protein [Alkalimonas sp. MEB108]MEE2003047.1 DUF1156 domain-containing protein [Alkalimonas sp. MEB108]
MAEPIPYALKDAPTLIEAAYPAQKISFEAQTERKAVGAQTLTGLGSYWKGRKPLILVRSIILGCLLPQTEDTEKDLEIFEMLMGFDIESLAKRALIQNEIKPADIAARVNLPNPWDYFSHNVKETDENFNEIDTLKFPINSDGLGLKLRWRRDIKETEKIEVFRMFLETIDGYEAKAKLCKRPEEVEQDWLYQHIWPQVNDHLKRFGIKARSIQEIIEQLGLLRYGRRPKIGDTFSGGGSIPFEAARLGCDAIASDLNPVACTLTWGAFNIVGGGTDAFQELSKEQERISLIMEERISKLGLESDAHGNKAKAYLYCLETKCPETGWMVPLSPSWVISTKRNVAAVLTPNYQEKRFNIEVKSGLTNHQIEYAKKGTVQDGCMVYELDGKVYRTPIKTIRGEHKDNEGNTKNNLRHWNKTDVAPLKEDVFQERLYAIQWFDKDSLDESRPSSFFASVTQADLDREKIAFDYVQRNIEHWQSSGLMPDMEIEMGIETEGPIRTNGWCYWHHLMMPRAIIEAVWLKEIAGNSRWLPFWLFRFVDNNTKSCRWKVSQSGGDGGALSTYDDQALNTFFNWANRSFNVTPWRIKPARISLNTGSSKIICKSAPEVSETADCFITDPPYADAVHYHEITELFISWLRTNLPAEFDSWTWDSRRALAIKGSGDDFRKGMIAAYKAMADHMPFNGMQCVMFTHQDTGVWSDMIGIFWAAGLQVVGAWYIATETTREQKKGAYVQGTVILMLRKRPAGENQGFKQRLLPAVRAEVKRQIETMMHLNDEVKDKLGEPVFNDSDLQMAGYAAALKVLTSYTHIGGEDVTSFALRPRTKGEVTVVDEIVQQAAEAANSLLVPEGLSADTWQKINGIQRFYLRMMDIETTGAAKLDNYQNFAKAFRVADYSRVMGNMAANKAQLKQVREFAPRDLSDSTEIGVTWLGHLIIGLQQILNEKEPQTVISQLQADLPDFMEVRPILIDMLSFIEKKVPEQATRDAAEVLGARLKNMRALGE